MPTQSSSGVLVTWVLREPCRVATLPAFPPGVRRAPPFHLAGVPFTFACLVHCDLQALVHVYLASDTPLSLSIAFPLFNDLSTQPSR